MINNELSEQVIAEGNFESVIKDLEGNIRFALPIPDFDFPIEINQNGDMVFSEFETEILCDAWKKYVTRKIQKQGKKYRTRNAAGKVAELNVVIPIITNGEFQYAMTMNPDKKAHMQLLKLEDNEELEFKEGKLYFKKIPASKADLVKLYTKEGISTLDLHTLRYLYGIILRNIQRDLPDMTKEDEITSYTVKIYVPDLMRMLGLKENASKAMTEAIVDKIYRYHNILGLMEEHAMGRTFHSEYPVMLYHGYDDKNNVVYFSSPYMNKIIKEVLGASVLKDKFGKPKLSKKGIPLLAPSHSYLIKSSLASEKNKRAAEIVSIVVTVIEQAGNNTPHISAQTIINRHPDLQMALKKASPANKNNILRRAFSAAWKFLDKHTTLRETYRNIKLEQPIPTMSTLDMVFEFPHEGKVKNKLKVIHL